MLILEEIRFLSYSFLFLAMSEPSRVRFRLFVVWNIIIIIIIIIIIHQFILLLFSVVRDYMVSWNYSYLIILIK